LEITPSAAEKAALDPRLPTRARVAKNEIAIFIKFTSFLVFGKYVRKADAKPRRKRKNHPKYRAAEKLPTTALSAWKEWRRRKGAEFSAGAKLPAFTRPVRHDKTRRSRRHGWNRVKLP
jgi:hypothetical protein